jgi:hypothetical protein
MRLFLEHMTQESTANRKHFAEEVHKILVGLNKQMRVQANLTHSRHRFFPLFSGDISRQRFLNLHGTYLLDTYFLLLLQSDKTLKFIGNEVRVRCDPCYSFRVHILPSYCPQLFTSHQASAFRAVITNMVHIRKNFTEQAHKRKKKSVRDAQNERCTNEQQPPSTFPLPSPSSPHPCRALSIPVLFRLSRGKNTLRSSTRINMKQTKKDTNN